MRRSGLRRLLIGMLALAGGGWLGLWLSLAPVEPGRLRPAEFESFRLFDRHGDPLGESLTEVETSATWLPLESFSADLVSAAVAAEDRRFFHHGGLDPQAIARAIGSNLQSGRVVSGASTLTQQVARMILADEARLRDEPPPRRSWRQKGVEAHLALRLERSFDKRRILEAWLNRVPVGGVARGMASGADRYFGAHPGALSLDQAALLVGLPRSPSVLRPDRDPQAARRRRDRVLQAMADTGSASPDRVQRAMEKRIRVRPLRTQPMRARLGAWVARAVASSGAPVAGPVRTTLDHALEEEIRAIVQEKLHPLRHRGAKSAAVVVLDHTTDEVLALVGSADDTDPRWGQVHAAFALRQPGSALKPFVYLAALEQGRTLATLAADVEQAFPDEGGAWLPLNYDRRVHGPVRYRPALAQSLNVSAVDVLREVGLPAGMEILQRVGITSIARRPEHYGLGMTLGSLDVQLVELTEAYAVLARRGVRRPTRVLADSGPGSETRIVDERHAWLIADALADPVARAPQFGSDSVLRTPYWTAVKTGTSKSFRDNLCLGFSERYTVGVWVGDPAGRPMRDISGVAGAGPIWRAVMDRLHEHAPSRRPPPPEGLVQAAICPLSGQQPGLHCPGHGVETFVTGTEPAETCAMHREVRLAKLDGLPLAPGCEAPAGPPRVVTLWPSPFDAWAMEHGLGVPDAWSRACPPPEELPARPPRLLAPAKREVLRIDPERPEHLQQLFVLADAGGTRGPVTLLVDGEPIGQSVGPRAALWTLSPGEHTFVARHEASGLESEPHVVTVF